MCSRAFVGTCIKVLPLFSLFSSFFFSSFFFAYFGWDSITVVVCLLFFCICCIHYFHDSASQGNEAREEFALYIEISSNEASWTHRVSKLLLSESPSEGHSCWPNDFWSAGPFGAFEHRVDQFDTFVLIAGGIGITGMLPWWARLANVSASGSPVIQDTQASACCCSQSTYALVAAALPRRWVSLVWVFRDTFPVVSTRQEPDFVDTVIKTHILARWPDSPDADTDALRVDATVHLHCTSPLVSSDALPDIEQLLEPSRSRAIHRHRGRPDVSALIATAIRPDSQRILVVSCGPMSLMHDVQVACRSQQELVPSKVIEFTMDSFES